MEQRGFGQVSPSVNCRLESLFEKKWAPEILAAHPLSHQTQFAEENASFVVDPIYDGEALWV